MQYSVGQTGRTITLRLEEGEPVYATIKKVVQAEKVERAVLWIIGGTKNGKVIVGPEVSEERPVTPMHVTFHEAHEILANGTLFPDAEGNPSLHIHASFGRSGQTLTGCPRLNLESWLVTEIIILEIIDDKPHRLEDENGFHILTIK